MHWGIPLTTWSNYQPPEGSLFPRIQQSQCVAFPTHDLDTSMVLAVQLAVFYDTIGKFCNCQLTFLCHCLYPDTIDNFEPNLSCEQCLDVPRVSHLAAVVCI